MQTMVKGFKHTEVGLIPEDWEVKKLGDLFDITAGGDFKKDLSSNIQDEKHPYPIYSNSLQDLGAYGFSSYYTNEAHCITVTARGTIGYSCYRDHKFTAIGRLLVLKPKQNIDCYFFSEYINNRIKFVLEVTGVPQLTVPQISKYEVSYPKSKAEQTAIATVLNDADALIGKLEQLIAKKRNIKKGAMQELLKPKEGWDKKRLGQLCSKITTGKLDANAMKLDGEYRFYTCAKDFFFIDKYAFDDEALLISGNGENVGYVHYYKGKFNAYQRTYVLTGFSLNVHFIKKYLDKFLADRIEVEVNAGNTPYIRKGTLTEMDIFFPKEETEQAHIAEVLTDMDNEIQELEKQLEKYKKIKQGMMQVLLTGKIRLNYDL